MDILVNLGNTFANLTDSIVIGFFKCVFYCFRFVQLFANLLEGIVEGLKAIFLLNNILVGSVLSFFKWVINLVCHTKMGLEFALRYIADGIVNAPSQTKQFVYFLCSNFVYFINSFSYMVIDIVAKILSFLGSKSTILVVNVIDVIVEVVKYFKFSLEYLLSTMVDFVMGIIFYISHVWNSYFKLEHFAYGFLYTANFTVDATAYVGNGLLSVLLFLFELTTNICSKIAMVLIWSCKGLWDVLFAGFSSFGDISLEMLYLPHTALCIVYDTLKSWTLYLLSPLLSVVHILRVMLKELEVEKFLFGITIIAFAFSVIVFWDFLRHVTWSTVRTAKSFIARQFYGHQNRQAAGRVPAQKVERKKREEMELPYCAVCHENVKTVVLIPCKHLCLCPDCLDIILNQPYHAHNCPLCRKKIDDYMVVYT